MGPAEKRGDEETRKRGNEETKKRGNEETRRRGDREAGRQGDQERWQGGRRVSGWAWVVARKSGAVGRARAGNPNRIPESDYAYEGESDCVSYELFIRSAHPVAGA